MLDQLNLSTLLDVCLLLFLGATISYCFVLNRKLDNMRKAQKEMQEIAKGFDQSIVRSKLGIEELKSLSETRGMEIHDEISRAEKLKEELSVMIASGSRIADRMHSSTTQSSKLPSSRPVLNEDARIKTMKPAASADVALTGESVFRSDAEKELIHALTKADQ
jgi:predicted RND superfamily exporter protein